MLPAMKGHQLFGPAMLALTTAAVALGGCVTGPARTTPPTNGSGLRVFDDVHSDSGRPVVCNAFTLGDGAIQGTLRVTPLEAENVWIEAVNGRHLSVAWPREFVLRLWPEAGIYDGTGKEVAADGAPIRLSQTLPESAAGTPDDPYLANACDFEYD